MVVTVLGTWIATALIGAYMLGVTLRTGRPEASATRSDFPTLLLFTHPALAIGGLIVWVLYMFNDTHALTWVAFVDLLLVATLGDVLLVRWLKRRRSAGDEERAQVAEQQVPPVAPVAHGLVGVTTIVLVLLVALGIAG